LDILEGPTWAKGLRFYQAAAAWTMVWQVAGALPVEKVIGWSASCLRNHYHPADAERCRWNWPVMNGI